MKVKDLTENYRVNYRKYRQENDRIRERIKLREKQMERLKKKLNSLVCPVWVNEMVKPIARELSKFFPDYTYDILGPFGCCAEISIHFYKKGVSEKERWDTKGSVLSINFIPLDLSGKDKQSSIGIRDYSKNSGEFKEGTVGAINGMNHPTVPIDGDTKIKDLVKWVL